MASARRCSECGKSLAGKSPRALTCSENCRAKRSRRKQRAAQHEEAMLEQPGGATVNEIVRTEAVDVIERELRDQLRPIVREAIDEDVMRAIDDMVGLTPSAVKALRADLDNEKDPVLRQRAYSLVIKYTLGNPNVAPPREATALPFQVNFNLPRPAELEPQPNDIVPLDGDIGAWQTCDVCHLAKPDEEFVGGSSRCQSCLALRKEAVLEKFVHSE